MEFILVLQLAEVEVDFERVVTIENDIADALEGIADIDGHDIGNGEVNFFIMTTAPMETFNKLLRVFSIEERQYLRAAFRCVDSDLYTVVYPVGLNTFKVS